MTHGAHTHYHEWTPDQDRALYDLVQSRGGGVRRSEIWWRELLRTLRKHESWSAPDPKWSAVRDRWRSITGRCRAYRERYPDRIIGDQQ